MVCRHSPGDPNCSSTQDAYERYYQERTPDKRNYQILDVKEEGACLVLKVQYPNCAKCSYEGVKVMVFPNVLATDALKWTEIDPHFSDPTLKIPPTQAPSPIARFPANALGWERAIAFAKHITL